MLEINKNINLNGVSKINGVQVAYMSATISNDGGSGANVNKAQVRKDILEFEQEVYKVEDELLASKNIEITKVGK